MLKKHDLGITPHLENISSRDQSLVRMGTSRVTLQDWHGQGSWANLHSSQTETFLAPSRSSRSHNLGSGPRSHDLCREAEAI